jgi:hypothetical protein
MCAAMFMTSGLLDFPSAVAVKYMNGAIFEQRVQHFFPDSAN